MADVILSFGTKHQLTTWIQYPNRITCAFICQTCSVLDECKEAHKWGNYHQKVLDFNTFRREYAIKEYIRLFGEEDIFELLL